MPVMKAQLLRDVIAAGSPFLRALMVREEELADRVFSGDPGKMFEGLLAEVSASTDIAGQAEFMRTLRRAKTAASLLIAAADVGGSWPVEQVTEALTRFADACLNAAVDWLLGGPPAGSGYAVLAMGKHGAVELNYSSDIDLIVLYDAADNTLAAGVEPATYFVRLTKKLVGLMQDMTEDGYVFRVDLRLRPDPRATQVAISVEAAAIYYESMGQNWERAAMIKARAVAGDIALGEEFLDRLKPYIWRKYLDFAAIADVQSLKRQIHAVKGHGTIAVQGHNIKLGRGGIREIEFFVQTQQLIAGGRNVKLRGRGTIAMLGALAEAQWITPETAEEMQAAYRFLRTTEHRVQMVNDEQTHVLPSDPEAFESLARFSGFADTAAFAAKLRATFECVQGHYAALFEDAGQLGTDTGSLVFTRGVYGNPDLPDFMVFLNWKELPWYWQGFEHFPFALLMIVLAPGLLAFIFGWFAFRARVTGVYLSIITQAMTFALLLAFFRNDMGFGGNNGLTDFKEILGFSIQADGTRAGLFFLSALALGLCFLICRMIVNSKFGRVVIAVRDAESRARFLGYRVERYKLFIFTVSAIMAGIAGALYVPQVGIINPSEFSPENSIEVVIWTAFGGRGTLWGAALGAIVINTAKSWFTGAMPDAWLFVLGGLFIFVTLFLPHGVLGLFRRREKRPPPKPVPRQATEPAE